MLGRTRRVHRAAAGTGTARRARTAAAPDVRAAAARLFLCAPVAAERLPAAAATTARLSLRPATTGPDPGRDARHRGSVPDADAGGGAATTAAGRSAVVLAPAGRLAALILPRPTPKPRSVQPNPITPGHARAPPGPRPGFSGTQLTLPPSAK